MQWLSENWGIVLVGLALLEMVTAIVRRLIRDKGQGRSACGYNCASCPMGVAYHKQSHKKTGRHRATLCLPMSGGIQMIRFIV